MKFISKNLLLLCFMLIHVTSLFSQSGDWVWLKGSNVGNSLGNYGTIGVPSLTNEPPARYQAAYWLDLQGNFWIFGGSSSSPSIMNDLWRYNPLTNEWTCINGNSSTAGNYGTKGVPSTLNFPPPLGYGSNCWTSPDGDLWLFGGSLIGGLPSDNLFRYHIATNEWTWMYGNQSTSSAVSFGPKGIAGASYGPGGRQECKSGWVYNNKLWLFGGYTTFSAISFCNDVWSYDLATNLWAWEGGGQTGNLLGVYGTMGVPSPSNEPPARCSYTKWQDNDNFYIFAGGDFYGAATDGRNDVWKFDKLTKEFTWISGTNTLDDLGSSTAYCAPNANSEPSARIENQTAQTASTCVTAFWTFGGFNFSGNKFHNDLWLFNTSNLEWTKVKGATSTGTLLPFSYGTKGVQAATNQIPGRGGPSVWSDVNGNLFVFGGGGGPTGSWAYLNDLWKFVPDTSCIHTGLVGSANLTAPSNTTLCPGDTISMVVPSNANISFSPNMNCFYDSILHMLYFYGSGNPINYTIIANSLTANDPCFTGDTVSFTINFIPDPIVAFTITPTQTTMDNPTFNLVNHSQNAVSYAWYDMNNNLLGTTKDLVVTEAAIGKYCYRLEVKNSCGVIKSLTKCAEILDNSYLVVPNVFSPNGDNQNDVFKPIPIGNMSGNSYSFTIYDRWGKQLFIAKNLTDGWNGKYKGVESESGVYFYLIETFNSSNKKLVYKGDLTLIR